MESRLEVSGYAVEFPGQEEAETIAARKRGSFWYIDDPTSGASLVSVGCKTREAAVNEYIEHGRERFIKIVNSDFYRRHTEIYNAAPLESDLEKWDSFNFYTLSSWRFDKLTGAAKRAGLIVKNADHAKYIDGGNVNIMGDAEKLAEIKELAADLIASEEKHNRELYGDPESAEEIQPETSENIQPETEKENNAEQAAPSDKLRETLEAVRDLPEIHAEIIGTWLWIDGNTFPVKEKLKAAGFRWSHNRRKWYYSESAGAKYCRSSKKDFEEIRKQYSATA